MNGIPDYNKAKVTRVLRVEQPDGIFFDIGIDDAFNMGAFIAMAKQLGHVCTPDWWVPMDQIKRISIVTFTHAQPSVLVGIPVEGKPN